MPLRLSHPDDVSVFAGLVQWRLWLGDPDTSARTQENARLLARIRVLHANQGGIMGSPRIWEDLRYTGERCGRHRVARLMRRGGFRAYRSGGGAERSPRRPAPRVFRII
jgi:transposase InsO family protein